MLAADGQLHGDDLRPKAARRDATAAAKFARSRSSMLQKRMRARPLGSAGPEALRLHLDAEDGVDYDQRRLDDAQRSDGVGQEAGVAGRIDQVEREPLRSMCARPADMLS